MTCFVHLANHHQIPLHGPDARLHGAGEIQGRDGIFIGKERRGVAISLRARLGDGIKNGGRQVELFFQFQTPLFADGRWTNDPQARSPLGPKLAKNERGLNGFAEPNFTGQGDALTGSRWPPRWRDCQPHS